MPVARTTESSCVHSCNVAIKHVRALRNELQMCAADHMINTTGLAARNLSPSVSNIPAALCKGEVVIMRHLYDMLHLHWQNQ